MPSDSKISASSSPASGSSGRPDADPPRARSPRRRSGGTPGPARPRWPRPRARPARPGPPRSRSPPGWSSTGCRPDRAPGDPRPGPDVDDHGPARLDDPVADHHPAGPVQPAPAPHEPAALLLEALDRHRVVPVVGGLVADATGHRGPVGGHGRRPGHRRAPARPRPGGRRPGSSSWRGRTPSRGTRHPPARRRCPPRRDRPRPALGHVLAPRPHPDHDHLGLFGHLDVLRRRATSKQAMAPATDTLREASEPCWGIDASTSHRLRVRVARPVSSEPSTRATG